MPQNIQNAFFPPGAPPIRIVRMFPQQPVQMHSHEFQELVIVFDGQGVHIAGQERYRIGTGDIFLIKPGKCHGFAETEKLCLVNILFMPELLNLPLYDLGELPGYHAFFELEPAMRPSGGFPRHLRADRRTLDFLEAKTGLLEKTLSSGAPAKVYTAIPLFMEIILSVASGFENISNHTGHPHLALFSEILGFLEMHSAEELALPQLARRFCVSNSTLYRIFHEAFGKSPINYLLDLRIAKAQKLLRTTDLTAGEISERSGFRDSNYFSRTFRKRTGFSPRAYREKARL